MSKMLPLAFFLTLLAVCGDAIAHAKLRSSIPANNARLTDSPPVMSLRFNEDVQLAMLTLVGGAKDIPLRVDLNAKAAPEVSVKLPPLAPGRYELKWSALSPSDGHVMKGSVSFTVLGPK